MKALQLISCCFLAACAPHLPPIATHEGQSATWEVHADVSVPNVFGEAQKRKSVRHGFYEQGGSVPSNASWESVAHYTYLGHLGRSLGRASSYSISPTGRFAALPAEDGMKIYDSWTNRHFSRPIPRKGITGYDWSVDERNLAVSFEDATTVTIEIPEP